MESSMIDLSKYRFETAKSDLNVAKLLLDAKEFRASVNRSYYAIFHALRAVVVLEGFDSSKHSGIIELFDKSISKSISSAFKLREKSDYRDFYIVSQEEATTQIEKAEQIIAAVEQYLADKW